MSMRELLSEEIDAVSGAGGQDELERREIADNPGEVDTIIVYSRSLPSSGPLYSYPVANRRGGISHWVRVVPNGHGGTYFWGTGNRYQGIGVDAIDGPLGPNEQRR